MKNISTIFTSAKAPLLAAVVLALLVGGAGGYALGRKAAPEKTETVANEEAIKEGVPEQFQDIDTPQSRFESFKKQIEENKTTDEIKKQELYINAALAAAQVKAPEAKDYARQALELMPDNIQTSASSKPLVDQLTAISNGNY